MKTSTLLTATGVLAACVALTACKDKDANSPDDMNNNQGFGAAGAPPAPTTTGAAGAGNPPPPQGQGGGATNPPPAANDPTAGPKVAPLDPTLGALLTPLIQPLGKQAPWGAKPLGSPIGGPFQQGQVAEFDFTMKPGKCYTAIGAGMPTIQQLDLYFVVAGPQGTPRQILAQAQGPGPTPVLGKKPNCFRNPSPVPVPAKFVVKATKGFGGAVGQLYER